MNNQNEADAADPKRPAAKVSRWIVFMFFVLAGLLMVRLLMPCSFEGCWAFPGYVGYLDEVHRFLEFKNGCVMEYDDNEQAPFSWGKYWRTDGNNGIWEQRQVKLLGKDEGSLSVTNLCKINVGWFCMTVKEVDGKRQFRGYRDWKVWKVRRILAKQSNVPPRGSYISSSPPTNAPSAK